MIHKPALICALAMSAMLPVYAQTPSFQPLAVQPTRPVSTTQPAAAAVPQAASSTTQPTFQPLAVQPTRPVSAQPVAAAPATVQPAPAPAAQPTFQPLAVQPTRSSAAASEPVATAQPAAVPANAPPLPQPGVPLQQAGPAAVQPKAVIPVQPVQPVAQPAVRPVAPVPVLQQPVVAQPAPPPTVPVAADTVAFPVYPEYTSGTTVALDPAWDENKLDKGKLSTRKESTSGGVAIGARVGTMGIGGDVTIGLLSRLNFRGGGSYGSFSWKPKFGDVKYDMDVDLVAFPLLLDWHPFGTGFRISAGAYIQPGTKASLTATPDRFIQIGSHRYNPSLLGDVTGEIEPSSPLAPYVGIGYGNAISRDGRLTFSFDLGLIYQRYDVSLEANGTVASLYPEIWQNDIQKEVDAIQDDFDKFPFYPILNFGIAFRF